MRKEKRDYRDIIGENAVVRRRALGLTAREVAKRMGCSAAHYSHLENGSHQVSIGMYNKAAEALGVTLEDLVRERK